MNLPRKVYQDYKTLFKIYRSPTKGNGSKWPSHVFMKISQGGFPNLNLVQNYVINYQKPKLCLLKQNGTQNVNVLKKKCLVQELANML